MRTFNFWGFVLFTTLLCLSACSSGSDNPIEPTPKPEIVKSEITIDSSLISNGLSFTNAGGDQSISFTTNENWTLNIANTTSGATWCTASTSSGTKGSVSVKFTVTENTDYENRSVSVTIKAGTASKTFTITQKSADALLVTTDKYEVGQKGGTIEIEVKANIDYQMEISEAAKDWITESSGRALSTYKHKLDISMNENAEKREGEIIFKSGDKSETVKVYQTGGAILLLSQNECNVSDKGDTISVDIKSNIEFGVQMPNVDWISDEASSRGMSSHTFKYIVSPNETYANRSVEIIFYDKNSELKDTLKINQTQKNAIVISKKIYEVKAMGETIEVELSANVDFEVKIPNVDWIIQTESRSLIDHKLYFKISENKSDEERNGIIIFENNNKQLFDTITIKQECIPYLTFTANTKQNFAMTKAIESFEYSVNNGNWSKLGWNTIDFGGELGSLKIRGKSLVGTATGVNNGEYSTIVFGNNVEVYCTGDIRTLVDYENYTEANTSEARFYALFSGCSNLIKAPKLPATTLATRCYEEMFYGCSSLAEAPQLPATTLASHCYHYMFYGCSNLSTAPQLPAMTLAPYCYCYMFYGTNLTNTPELPALEMKDFCYAGMFKNCSKLNHIIIYARDISAYQCLNGWVENVATTGTFVKVKAMQDFPMGSSGIPNGWTIKNYGEE